MSSGAIKLVVGASLLAAVAGPLFANNMQTPPAAGKNWLAGWLDGIQISRNAPVAAPPASAQAVATQAGSGYGRVDLRPDAGGQYQAQVDIEGMRIAMLVDTGATLISLTSEDASRLGIRPAPSDYSVDIQTANGIAKAARVRLNEVRLETLSVRSVDAIVLPRDVRGKSLLGMSFLKKLGGFEIAQGTLVLRQ